MNRAFSMVRYPLFGEILISITVVLLVVVGSIGWYITETLSNDTKAQHFKTLQLLAAEKSGAITHHVETHLKRIKGLVHQKMIVRSIWEFSKVYGNGVNSREYADVMQAYSGGLEEYLHHWGYYDLFLINPDGEIIYTVKHEADFATNLLSGPYQSSKLSSVFRNASRFFQANNSTFEFYTPSQEPAAFLAAPVIENGQFMGVVALQFNTDAFYKTVNDLSGLGNTGETVVGQRVTDHVLISTPLRHDPDAAFKRIVGTNSPGGKPILQATRGISGFGTHSDWRGRQVVAAWQYVPAMDWGIVVKIDEEEAFSELYNTQDDIIIFTLLGLIIAYMVALLTAYRITRPIINLTETSQKFSSGDRDIRADVDMAGQNETALLATAFNSMADQIQLSERSLIQDRERLAIAVEQSQDGIILTDPDAIIQYVNRAFEHLSGYSAEEAVGQNVSIVKSGELSDEFYQAMWGDVSSGKVWRGELINRHKSGELYTVDQTISPLLDENGQITGYTSLQRDITEKKGIEKRIEHAQRLESLGVLAGGIAHDFNNLLTAILGNASLAKSRIDPDSPIATMLNSIEKASERAADLCKQMLAYSGKGKFIVKPLDLSLLIEEMLNLLKISIGKNVSLNLNIDSNHPFIQADATQMRQIIMNLIINASEAIGDEPGTINIHTGSMDADKQYLDSLMLDDKLPEGKYVFLEISDNGCGMNKEVLSKIFDPFFTTKFTGRGLGMSAILGIVRGHQGTIKIYSEPEQGTTFKLLFPASDAEGLAIDAKYTQNNEWNVSGTILVVDDEKSIQETAQVMLENMGFEVILANDGVEGVDQFRQHHEEIVAVLLDMTMPRMNGEEAFREMRLIDAKARVILSSGYNEQDATSQFAGKGLAGFIQKPYFYDTLKTKMIQIMD